MADEIVPFEGATAALNVTYGGENGDFPDRVPYDISDEQVKQIAMEGIRDGYIPGISPDAGVDLTDFVVDRFQARDGLPDRLLVRPKTPFGVSTVRVDTMQLEDMDILQFGHTIQLSGVVYAGEKDLYFCMLPSDPWDERAINMLDLSQEDWEKVMQQTDRLETEVLEKAEDGKLTKAIVRKSARQVGQGVSWSVFHRDHYHCRYCGAGEGVPLTVDHLVLWEDGGPSTEDNLVAACRRCNRTRGRTPYAKWLKSSYYKRVSRNLPPVIVERNEDLKYALSDITPRHHTRSR